MEELENTLDLSAEQEGVVGSPTDAESTTDEGGKAQETAAPAKAESTAEENRRIAAARRRERQRAADDLDAEIAGKGYTGADGKPITSKKEMFAYFEAQQEQALAAEAKRQNRSVEELRRENAERAAGRKAMQAQKSEREINDFMQRDLAEFAENYPEVNAAGILKQGSRFLKFCGSRFGKESMSDLYADYLGFSGADTKRSSADSKSERGTGSGSGNAGKNTLTADQKKALDEWNNTFPGMRMTEDEYLKREK